MNISKTDFIDSTERPVSSELQNVKRHAILLSKWNSDITDLLLIGAQRFYKQILATNDCTDENQPQIFSVPGAFELGSAAAKLAETKKYDAIICLGCVIRGETTHYDYVCTESARLIAQASYDYGIPVIFGVITSENYEQAQARASLENIKENKGYAAAAAAIHMTKLYEEFNQ